MRERSDTTQAYVPAARAPAMTMQPAPRRTSEAELAPQLRRRLMFIAACGAAAFALNFLVIVVSDGLVRPHRWGILVIAAVHAAVVLSLRRKPALTRRHLVPYEWLVFAPGAAFYTWATADALSFGDAVSVVGSGGMLANYVSLPWVIVVVVYGVLIPNTGRRCGAIVGALCLLGMGSTVAGLLWADAPLGAKLGLFCRVAVWLGVASAIVTAGAYRIEALRREAKAARSLGPYTLVRRLGFGGMGEVFYASHALLRRPCAVKIIRPDQAADPDAVRMFESEVQAAAQLSHPNAVRVYDYGRADDGTFYYVMEYLPGVTLHELVSRHGPLPAGRAVFVLRQICSALGAAHAAGLVHRDVKPGNVIVGDGLRQADFATLLDFGLVVDRTAGASGEIAAVGTPSYMAPEQAAGGRLDHRIDLYAVGSIAYFLLTGRPPFEGRDLAETLAAVELDEPTPIRDFAPDAPDDLQRVVMKCLAKKPGDRYGSADELDAALAGCSCPPWTPGMAAAWWASRPGRVPAGPRPAPAETEAVPTSHAVRE